MQFILTHIHQISSGGFVSFITSAECKQQLNTANMFCTYMLCDWIWIRTVESVFSDTLSPGSCKLCSDLGIL